MGGGSAIINELSPCFCPSRQNIVDQDHSFRLNTEQPWANFREVRGPEDWPIKILPTKSFWPTNRQDNDKLKKCIELVALSKNITYSQLQRYEFTPCFIGDLIMASRREQIADKIVHRLRLNTQEAAGDQQLRDEELSSGIRRFRVTQRPSSLRIHYEFRSGVIVFLRFFDEGHHDDGL